VIGGAIALKNASVGLIIIMPQLGIKAWL